LAAQQQAAASSKNAEAAAERDQLKEKIARVEKELNSTKTELDGANDRNNKLRERLRQFQKMIQDLRAKEKELVRQLAEAASRGGQQQPTTDVVGEGPTPPTLEQEAAKPTQASKPKVAEDTDGKPDIPIEAPAPAASRELLRPPPGGFSFGPSEAATKAQAKELTATAEIKSHSAGSVFVQASTTSQPTVSASVPVATQKPDDEGGNVPSTPSSGDAPSAAPASLLSPKTTPQALLPPRRNSGNKAELSMKERLLEKKRLLAERVAKKKELQRQAVEAGENAEPSQKRQKLESEKGDAAAASSPVPPAQAPIPSQKDQVMTSESKDKEEEEGEVAEALVEEDSKTETAPLSSAPESAGVAVTGGVAFGRPSGLGAINPFGGAPAPFGIGSAPVFGSAASISVGTTFGSKVTSNPSSGGGAFLDLTPPGTQATPPTFQFGTGGNITLPTPSTRQTSTNSPFGAFSGSGSGSSPNPFGAFGGASPGGGAKPLFGSAAATEEPKQEEAEKMADVEQTDA
jgi:hypothetical protein